MAKDSIRNGIRELLTESLGEHRQMARNFLKSMFLLSVALLAAIYSNSSAHDGRVISAGVGALIAMSIAIWVGLRFVPRLAAGVDWEWLPFFTRYRLTRDGWIYISATIVVLSAAINTSNNLLYMVLSALLAVMILSGFLSGLNFRFLDVTARLPEDCFAGQPFQISLTVRNPKRIFPSFSLNIYPPDGQQLEFDPYYIPLIPVRGQNTRTLNAILPKRGRHILNAVNVGSRYPFGFISKSRTLTTQAQCIAFPKIVRSKALDDAVEDLLGSSERFERGHGVELYMIRDYVTSDSARHLDWKASAKTSTLKTREFAAEESRKVLIFLDRYGQEPDADPFERLVSEAASLAFHLCHAGVEVSLESDEWKPPVGQTDTRLQSILCYLALVEMTPEADSVGFETPGTIVFSLRGAGSAETLWNDTSKSHSMR